MTRGPRHSATAWALHGNTCLGTGASAVFVLTFCSAFVLLTSRFSLFRLYILCVKMLLQCLVRLWESSLIEKLWQMKQLPASL